MPFKDRAEAGRRLGDALASYKAQGAVVLALPRGGVPVAAEIAAALGATLDLLLVRKIGLPAQPELAMGAVVDGPNPTIVRNEDVISMCEIKDTEFQAACEQELAEIARRRKLYFGERSPVDLTGRVVIVVDDGIATGATTRAALRSTRMRKPKKLILAVAVGSTEALEGLRAKTDVVVCLEQYENLGAIGMYYADFRQVTDREVVAILDRFVREIPARADEPASSPA
jgi:predicted phosphoribosyltransferase